MNYLKCNLVGKAKQIVDGVQLTNANYELARNWWKVNLFNMGMRKGLISRLVPYVTYRLMLFRLQNLRSCLLNLCTPSLKHWLLDLTYLSCLSSNK